MSDTKTAIGLMKFGGITKEAAENARKRVKSGSQQFYEWKDGLNVLRFLPPPPGKDAAWVITSQHFLKNWAGGGKVLSFNCPKQMMEGRCPACDRYEQLMASGNPVDRERAAEYRPRYRVFANVIDRNDEEAGVQVVGFGKMILDQITELVTSDDVYGQDFSHPLEGDDLVIKRGKEKGFTKYSVNIRNARVPGEHDRLAATDEQIIKWLEVAPDLQTYATVLSYEDLIHKAAEMTAEARGEPIPERKPKKQSIAATQEEVASVTDIPLDAQQVANQEVREESPFTGAEQGMVDEAASDTGQTDDLPF